MGGLILKDIYNSSKNLRYYAVFIFVFSIVGYMMETSGYICVIQTIMAINIGFSVFNYDEYNHWDLFALTLPVERKTLVAAKYLECFLLCLITAVICLICSAVTAILLESSIIEAGISCYACFCAALLMLALVFPLIYKVGVEKARVALMIIFGLFAFGLVILTGFSEEAEKLIWTLENSNPYIIAGGAVVLFLVFYYLSYKLSVSIYRKKAL